MAGASVISRARITEFGPTISTMLMARRVSIKGRTGDEAALCTSNETYALRLAEATNTLVRLLISSMLASGPVDH